jgi:hypothetical protein
MSRTIGKSNPRLTLNLGLRYEYNPWPAGLRNQMTLFDRATGQIILSSQVDLDAQQVASRPSPSSRTSSPPPKPAVSRAR